MMMRTRESNREGKGVPRVLGQPAALNPGFQSGGFTLDRIAVVMMIITVVIAMTIPGWVRTGSRSRTAISCSNSPKRWKGAGCLRHEQRHAGLLQVERDKPGVRGGSPPTHPIPLNVEICANRLEQDPGTGDFIITFYPDGSLVGDDVDVIFDNTRTYGVHINPLFGTVRVENGGGGGG